MMRPFDNDHCMHVLCALYSFCLFGLLLQGPSLLHLLNGRQIVHKRDFRTDSFLNQFFVYSI